MAAASGDYAIEVVLGKTNFVRLVSTHNGQTLMVGETYDTKWGARRAGKRLADKNNFVLREVFSNGS